MKIDNSLMNIKSILLDLFFPKFCTSCREEGRYLCKDCLLFLSESLPICPNCFKVERYGRVHEKCKERSGLSGLVALYDYEGVTKRLIYQTKYESLIEIPHEIVEYGLLSIEKNRDRFFYFLSFLYDRETALAYVPLSGERQKKRGFNQAEEIAKAIARFTNKEVVALLLKQKNNRSQKNLDKKQRRKNVKDVFVINKETVKVPSKVIIVDDVYTSGATLKECTKTLKRGGVKEVWGFVLARVS